ncbi:MAG: hypothetical protein KDA32_11050 [Phycisphaerales bacterium]|nr:hypothetical protein [Phycisphaerales bacterium]
MPVVLVVGTAKGGFVCRSDDRLNWDIEGPFLKGWGVTAAARGPAGDWLVGTTSFVYGAAIHRSDDLREFAQAKQGPAYSEDSGVKLEQIWKIVTHGKRAYAGVAQAGLFVSDDNGDTWQPVNGLNQHPTRAGWMPGAGGLCCHAILFDPKNPLRMWVGISAVGVFRSDDGGKTWQPKNAGVKCILEDKDHKDIGFCVHGLVADPADANRIYRQDHSGMYRSSDGGDTWTRNETGLSSRFGFPIAIDPHTKALFVAPLESDEFRLPVNGQLQIFRSTDNGDSWHALFDGLPQKHAYGAVMRGALGVDGMDPCGVYFGTTAGEIFASHDRGESWHALPCRLPRVHSVTVLAE